MKLKPVIASYSGESFRKIKQYLDENVLELVASIAESPKPCVEIAPEMVTELVEMHVLTEGDELVRLNTAVFSENDIGSILWTIAPLAKELSLLILERGAAFQKAPAEVTLFLGGIIGLVQGMGKDIGQKRIGSAEWKRYTGKYARSKVDFDEICDLYDAIGTDYLNKSVLQGEQYTAVFIGPGGNNFQSLNPAANTPDVGKGYVSHINRFMVDSFARLVSGKLKSDALQTAAETASLYKEGRFRSAVITNGTLRKYGPAINKIIEVSATYYESKLEILDELLRATTSGRQGVPPVNMMLNLWRYIRKMTAKELYENGFFTDSIPKDGCLTVFYENNVQLIRQLLF